ncbi:hypothetical protein GCM10022225_29740 [Plantactinospora mayteni]|uniref:HTH luxR-type domain-containing protein n=1 Tax=Plantactinospora mayteni TaxID=566021 RepID=A0ABQ4ESX5_9ACTN|nr:hypothetical protein [Plantactinospora mayteni]GIG97762.1 hypothetical protein Pma05_43350 [Plantactinospora mayteni]
MLTGGRPANGTPAGHRAGPPEARAGVPAGGGASRTDLFRQAAAVVASPVGADRPAQWFVLLRRVVRYDAAWLSLFDERQHLFAEVASTGYDDRIRNYFQTPEVVSQAEQAGLTESPLPQRGRDLPVPATEYPVWSDYYLPAGYREGLAVGLFSRDRRHLGMLVLSTEDPDHPTDAERDLIRVLAPRIARTLDPLRSLSVLARVVHDAVAGVVLTRTGETLPLSGLPGHPLLAVGSALLAVVGEQAPDGDGSISFLWHARPLRRPSSGSASPPASPPASRPASRPVGGAGDVRDGLLRVLVLGCAAPSTLTRVVMLAPLPGGRCPLNRRELVVLGLLLAGWTDERVAVGLDLPLAAVAEAVERSVAVLQAPDRHVALLRAARRGWFIPHLPGTAPPD